MTRLNWDNQNRGISQWGLERRLDRIVDEVLQGDPQRPTATRRKKKTPKSRMIDKLLSPSGLVHTFRKSRTLCGLSSGKGWTRTSARPTCLACLRLTSAKQVPIAPPVGSSLNQSKVQRAGAIQNSRKKITEKVEPRRITPPSALPVKSLPARSGPKTVEWAKLKVGNLVHEADCSIAWLVERIDSGKVSVRRTRQSRKPGPDTATLNQSQILSMHRFEDCGSSRGQQRGKVKQDRSAKPRAPEIPVKPQRAKRSLQPLGARYDHGVLKPVSSSTSVPIAPRATVRYRDQDVG